MEISDKLFNSWKKKLKGPRWLYHGDAIQVDFCDDTQRMTILDKRTSEEYIIEGDKAKEIEHHIIYNIVRRADKEKYARELVFELSSEDQKVAIRIAEGIIKKEESNEPEVEEENPVKQGEINEYV